MKNPIKMNFNFFSTTFLFLVFVTGSYAQSAYYPDSTWKTKNPAELKINKKGLDSAVLFAMANENKVAHR